MKKWLKVGLVVALLLLVGACTTVRQLRDHGTLNANGKAEKTRTDDALDYSVATTIKAPSQTVWDILTDAKAYTSWNSTIIKLEGEIAHDNTIELTAKISPDRTFELTVSKFEPPHAMIWEDGGSMFLGVRTFTLTGNEDGSTTFAMSETLSGGMLGMIEDDLPDFTKSFEDFALDLKKRAEAEAAKSIAVTPAVDEFKVLSERFADIEVLRYRVPGFEALPSRQKEMLYYLYEAARAGHDIKFDQHYRHNLAVKRTLEAILRGDAADRTTEAFKNLHLYAKQVWFAGGIHHHYASSKFEPKFSKEDFAAFVRAVDAAQLPLDGPEGKTRTVDELIAVLTPVIFDPSVDAMRVNRGKNLDVIAASANNFYEGVTQAEVEEYYKSKGDSADLRPVSWGLNSKLVKQDGKLVERVWKVGGMYGPAIEKIVFWLEKAAPLAENPKQKKALDTLIAFYKTGDLKLFDDYNIAWVQDTDSRIDVVNGFIETYGDALGFRADWEAVVSIKDLERSKRIASIGAEAKWFEDHSPIADNHKKTNVVGISAKVITVVAEGGATAPTTPVGINLPNSGWIRKEHGSKSVFLGNIVDAYQQVSRDSGVLEAFAFSPEEIARGKKHGMEGYSLKVDMHEVIGHASGQLEPGVGTPKETLKNYAAALEEARADLVALYYVMDPKLVELGVMESLEVGKAAYDGYLRNGLLTQLARLKPGAQIAQSHMRNRHMVTTFALTQGGGAVEKVERNGDVYYVVRDYDKLREVWGTLLKEVQRIKSQGDFAAGRDLIEKYGVNVDAAVHRNVLARYAKLGVRPYSGFIQPVLVPVLKDGKIVDVTIDYPNDFTKQMLDFSAKHSLLPTYN